MQVLYRVRPVVMTSVHQIEFRKLAYNTSYNIIMHTMTYIYDMQYHAYRGYQVTWHTRFA